MDYHYDKNKYNMKTNAIKFSNSLRVAIIVTEDYLQSSDALKLDLSRHKNLLDLDQHSCPNIVLDCGPQTVGVL